MADFSLYGDGSYTGGTTTVASGIGVTVTSSSSANTKGSYTEILASSVTARKADGFMLTMYRTGGAKPGYDILTDIAIGGAGSEQVILSNLLGCRQEAGGEVASIFFPISIPGSTRVSCRTAAASGSTPETVSIQLLHGGFKLPQALSGAEGLGTSAGDSGGTGITSGNGSKSAYVEIIGSTTKRYYGLIIATSGQSGLPAGTYILIDVAVGAGAAEQIIIPNYGCQLAGGTPNPSCFFPVDIPAGTRLAVRAAGSAARAFDISLVGFY